MVALRTITDRAEAKRWLDDVVALQQNWALHSKEPRFYPVYVREDPNGFTYVTFRRQA